MNQDLKDEIASLKQEIGSLRKAINKKSTKPNLKLMILNTAIRIFCFHWLSQI